MINWFLNIVIALEIITQSCDKNQQKGTSVAHEQQKEKTQTAKNRSFYIIGC